jgi:3-oxoacyl-[acyl-carrier protein] reductase
MRRVVIITGGASGLGRYMTLEFARRGYTVAFTYQNSVHAALQLEESLCGMDCLSHAEQIDVASEKAVSAFVQRVLGAFGRIDTLINNAGIFENSLIADTTLESWNRVIRVDLTGSFLFIKHVFPVMKAQMEGSIVNITSVMGESGIYGACSYAAAKAGLIGLTKSVALEGPDTESVPTRSP